MKRLLALLLTAWLLSGCTFLPKKTRVVDVPQGVEERNVRLWFEATGHMKVISATMLEVTKATIALHEVNPQAFDSEQTYQNLLSIYERVALAGKRGNQVLGNVPKQFDDETTSLLRLVFDQILQELQKSDLELFGVKSQEGRAKIQTLLGTVRLTIQAARF